MLAEYRDVIPLVENPIGWGNNNVWIKHNPNPAFSPELTVAFDAARQRTIELRSSYGDFNAPKTAVRRLLVQGGNLDVETYLTEYFVLWGIPGAVPDLHKQALEDLRQKKETEIPMGISTHNIVLITPDRTKSADNIFVAMIINDPRHGFAPGRLSVSYEGQMDPTIDTDSRDMPSTHITVLRTLQEEFGIGLDQSKIRINPDAIRLIAVCAEKGSAYTSWCHIAWVRANIPDLVASYNIAPRRKSADALLAVPLNEISAFAKDEITPQDYKPYLVASSLTAEPTLKPHPTVPWRIDALLDHLRYLGVI